MNNAVIMAAGTSSRFAPLSYEMPKALVRVKGEVLIERQIRQMQEAGIRDIIVVAGYKKEQLYYLQDKYGVTIVENKEYLTRNNHSSIYAARHYLGDTYICSADNYFTENPFESMVEESYYAGVYAKGKTSEWCMTEDGRGYISDVRIGGSNSWYMLGHAFWNKNFSGKFIHILEAEYEMPEIKNLLWESIFSRHLNELKMRIRKYGDDMIYEFDTLEDLRGFDPVYSSDSGSKMLQNIVRKLDCTEESIVDIHEMKNTDNEVIGFGFRVDKKNYYYNYKNNDIISKTIESEK